MMGGFILLYIYYILISLWIVIWVVVWNFQKYLDSHGKLNRKNSKLITKDIIRRIRDDEEVCICMWDANPRDYGIVFETNTHHHNRIGVHCGGNKQFSFLRLSPLKLSFYYYDGSDILSKPSYKNKSGVYCFGLKETFLISREMRKRIRNTKKDKKDKNSKELETIISDAVTDMI